MQRLALDLQLLKVEETEPRCELLLLRCNRLKAREPAHSLRVSKCELHVERAWGGCALHLRLGDRLEAHHLARAQLLVNCVTDTFRKGIRPRSQMHEVPW